MVDTAHRAGFDALMASRYDSLLRTGYRLCGNWASAEDLVQTSLAKTWLRWDRLREPQAAEAYTRKVMATTSASWWRRRAGNELPLSQPPVPAAGVPDASDAIADRGEVQAALAKLPPRMRTVLVLRVAEDLSEAAVAELLGISVGTVKSTTSKALTKLRLDPDLLAHHDPAGDLRMTGAVCQVEGH